MERCALYLKEHNLLRQELQGLKECQLRFLTLSVTVTALLFAYIAQSNPGSSGNTYYLFPLVIVIPSWWIFFDKAKSISRIVGYYRNLEDLMLQEENDIHFDGWENALERFRRQQHEKSSRHDIGWGKKLSRLLTTHRYLSVGYATFMALSTVCILLSKPSIFLELSLRPVCYGVSFVISLFSAGYLLWLVTQLIWGRHSYESNYYFWRKDILKRKQPGSQTVPCKSRK